jgi:hypothetical protein
LGYLGHGRICEHDDEKSASTKAANFLPTGTFPKKSLCVELVYGKVKVLQFGPVFILQGRRDERTIKAK